MIVTTTPSIEGKTISACFGVVAGEAILGANVFKDLFASIRDVVGGRSATYERELQRAREIVLAELAELAERAKVLGQANSMLMVSASGTAVRCA